MRIGIDIRSLDGPIFSGVGQYIFNLLQQFPALDSANEYHLYSNSFKARAKRHFENKGNIFQHHYRTPNIINHFTLKYLKYPCIDRLVGSDVFFMPNLNFIALKNYSRALITIHDISFLKYPEFYSLKRRLWHQALNLNKLLPKFGRIVAVSESTKQDLIEFYQILPEKIEVVYSGINNDYSQDRDGVEAEKVKSKYGLPDKYILFLGTIEPRKNIAGLIEAFEIFQDKSGESDCVLVIAGSLGWKTGDIVRRQVRSKYAGKIKFIGYVEEADKKHIYRLAELFVYPSFYEGFGFPPLEAMACGVPVIAGQNSSQEEILGNAALLANPADAEEIAHAIGLLYGKSGLRSEYRSRGLLLAQKFDWRKTALNYLKIFEKL